MKKDRIAGLPRNVFLAGLTSLFNDFSSEMIVSIFPAFFESVLKSGAASLGLVEGFAEFASNFIKIISGSVSDKINNRKWFAVAGYALSTLTRPFFVAAGSVGAVLGLRFTDRIGKGLRDSPRDALISLSTPPEELGRSFGFHRGMDTLGAVLGPLVAFLILRRYPGAYNSVFITAFFIGTLGVVSILLVKEVQGAVKKKFTWKNLTHFSSRFKFYLLSTFILSSGALPVAILLLRVQNAGLAIAFIPLFYSLYNIAYAGLSPIAGKIADAIGDRTVLLLGYLSLFLAYGCFALAPSTATVITSFIILGLYSGFTDAVARSYAGRLIPEELRGTSFGYLNAATGIGALISGIGGGYVWQNYSPSSALISGAIILTLGIIIFITTQFRGEVQST